MIVKIAFRNLVHKPLASFLSVLLLGFSVGIITLLLLMQSQVEEKFTKDLRGIDMVLGAKGSPLQLVLSAIYHLDAPTGNIKQKEAARFLSKRFVKEAIPLAYGDSYKGYRLLGTTAAYLEKYEAVFEQGTVFEQPMQAVLGANVAQSTGLKLHEQFLGTHGEVKEGHAHEENPYQVVGILKPTYSVLDNLILSNVASVWQVHQKEGHEEVDSSQVELTAMLVKFRSPMAMLSLPRSINQQSTMQAALPSYEMNRLFYLLGVGANTFKLIGGGIMFVSALSVFFALYSRLRERKHELALLRAVGYRPLQLFLLLVSEGLILSILGYFFGFLLSRLGLVFINTQAASDFHFQFTFQFEIQEAYLLGITLVIGLLAALLPALKAMRLEVATVLGGE